MTETLSSWSNVLLYVAMAFYAAAFVAFAMDLAGRGAARTASTSAVGATRRRELAAVGAGAASAGRGSTVVLEDARDGADTTPHAGSAALGRTRAEERDGWRDTRATASLRIAMVLMGVGWVAHLGAALTRGIAAGRVPWSNMFEFSMTSTLLIVLVFFLSRVWADLRFLGTFISGFVTIVLGIASLGFYVDVVPLVPALQSVWLVIHVFVASLATGCLALGFGLSVLQLLQVRRIAQQKAGVQPRIPFLASLPDADRLENLAYRINIVGFILWTFTLVAGAIWAERAWGRYWGWDTKEVWTFIIWVVYAGYIHARATKGWRGTPSAWLAIVGFSTVMFNFGVVNVFFKGLHAYSGL